MIFGVILEKEKIVFKEVGVVLNWIDFTEMRNMITNRLGARIVWTGSNFKSSKINPRSNSFLKKFVMINCLQTVDDSLSHFCKAFKALFKGVFISLENPSC